MPRSDEDERDLHAARARMVDQQLKARGVADPRVLDAMGKVPREAFVPMGLRHQAYADTALPLEYGATISQPFIVALMTELARVRPGDRVLEIGTGSGYQSAILAELGAEVHSVEVTPWLAQTAKARLDALGYDVEVRTGDGWRGLPEAAPYAAIVVTAAPPTIPEALADQLVDGGRIVIPIGSIGWQELCVLTKRGDRLERRDVTSVAFVPLRRTDAWDHDAA